LDQYRIALMKGTEARTGKLREKLVQQIGALSLLVSLELECYPRHRMFVCSRIGEGRWTAVERKRVRRELARAVARFVLEDEEEALLREIFVRDYRYTAAADQEKLLTYCRRAAAEGDEPARKKTQAIRLFKDLSDTVEACLTAYESANVDGIIKFRLTRYRQELKETADYAVDEYLMDKQYQEFISLLKYFVLIQQVKVPSVHVLHRGGSEFELLNDNMETLEPVSTEGITYETLEKELNFEDLIVSSLITMAPERIYIHTGSPDTQVIRTIRQIFEDRVILCEAIAK
jgi:putative sporulation protein YtxC